MSIWKTLAADFAAFLAKEKPELQKVEHVLANVQKELAPLEGQALGFIVQAGAAAASTVVTGSPLTLSAVETAVVLGGRAALAEASKQAVPLTEHAALSLAAAAGVPLPAVPNGVNQ